MVGNPFDAKNVRELYAHWLDRHRFDNNADNARRFASEKTDDGQGLVSNYQREDIVRLLMGDEPF